MRPAASFIVPAYNEEKNIKVCIDSLLAQTEPNFEIIVIDDGSTDNTFEIVKSIQDSRIKVFRQINQGRVATRNRALQLSRGKYIILQDADDWSEPDRLKKQLLMAESVSNGMPVIGTGFELHKEDRRRTYKRLYPEKNSEIRKIMNRPILAGAFHPPTMLALRQHILNHEGWRSKFKVTGEDGDLICRLFEDSNTIFGNVTEALYHYRLNQGSVTNIYRKNVPAQMFKRYCKLCRKNGVNEPVSFTEYKQKMRKNSMNRLLYNLEYVAWCVYMWWCYR